MSDPAGIPLEFLLDSSDRSLQDLELAALNRSANLSKAVRVNVEQWVEQLTAAAVARWMVENRERLTLPRRKGLDVKDVFTEEFKRKSA